MAISRASAGTTISAIASQFQVLTGGTARSSGAAAFASSASEVSAMITWSASAAVGAASEELGPMANLDALVRLALRKASKA